MVGEIKCYLDRPKCLTMARDLHSNMEPTIEIPDILDQRVCYVKLMGILADIRFQIHQVVGAGDCYFRSMSHQILNTEEYHPFFRAVTADYMRDNRDSYEYYVKKEFPNKDYLAYCDEVAKLKTPVGEIPILASCEAFGIKIIRIFSYGDRVVEVLVPRRREYTKVIFISFIYLHADSVFPIGTMPPPLRLPLSQERLNELKEMGSYNVIKDHGRNLRFDG